jgi:SAM-dependent methyltransferase
MSDADLLRATQSIYVIPSLAAWRAAELRVLRSLGSEFVGPILEIGCGSGLFSGLLFSHVEIGIDYNLRTVDLCKRRADIYTEVRRMDARKLEFPDGAFKTVFANCVIEHISGLDRMLAECHRVLAPGGAFITTVPLDEFDRHLLLPYKWYIKRRAKDLEHVNLLSQQNWEAAFHRAGFGQLRVIPYLSGTGCKLWDHIDGPACFGIGPLRVARVYKMMNDVLPSDWRARLARMWHRRFGVLLEDDPSRECCAVAVIARRGPFRVQ